MTRTSRSARAARATTLTVALATALAMGTAALADEPGHGHGSQEPPATLGMKEVADPLSEDLRITDEIEAGLTATPAGVTCTRESTQSAPNPQPASPAFVLLHVHPYDKTPADHLDVPKSCNDGSVIHSSVAKSSRNLQTFLAAQNAGINIRTQNIAYVHNYTGETYPSRGVRRFKSPTSTPGWASLRTFDNATKTSDKLTRLRKELDDFGFNVPNTRYSVVLDAADKATCTTICEYYGGAAEGSGAYGFALRYWVDSNGTRTYHRFGCATPGDVTFGHEQTHQVGAAHVYDHARDLMTEDSAGNYTYRNGALWDYGRNTYHADVKASVYVPDSNLPGTYYTC